MLVAVVVVVLKPIPYKKCCCDQHQRISIILTITTTTVIIIIIIIIMIIIITIDSIKALYFDVSELPDELSSSSECIGKQLLTVVFSSYCLFLSLPDTKFLANE